jgi:hypothetical protein
MSEKVKTSFAGSEGSTLPVFPDTDAVFGRQPMRASAKPTRLPHQSCTTPPPGAKPLEPGWPLGFGVSVVPVSAVAREWGVSSRRVRVMLTRVGLQGGCFQTAIGRCSIPIVIPSARAAQRCSVTVNCRNT